MNVTLTEREMRALSRLLGSMGELLVELGAEVGVGAVPARRPSLVLVEGSAKRRTRPRGKLRAIRD